MGHFIYSYERVGLIYVKRENKVIINGRDDIVF
jgi:hypothetical protein